MPKREYPEESQKKRVNRIITALIVVIIVPSVYTAYTFVEQNNFNIRVEEYITLEARLESERLSFESPTRLLDEVKAINEKVENLAIGTLTYGENNSESRNSPKNALVHTVASSSPVTNDEAMVIEKWLGRRINDEDFVIYFRPEPVDVLATSSVESQR